MRYLTHVFLYSIRCIMFEVILVRRNGTRLTSAEMDTQLKHSGDFVLDVANGAKRLRIKSPWTGQYAPVELYEPMLIAAQNGILRWRGFERVADQGFVQEWHARSG